MTREEAITYGKRVIDLGLNDETQAFCEMAIEALEQEPKTNFERKAEIVISQLRADRDRLQDALDKIRAEIEQVEINGHIRDVECFSAGINTALNIIDKYRK